MIKKAVLPVLLVPFLMVFSSYAFSDPYFRSYSSDAPGRYGSPAAACATAVKNHNSRTGTKFDYRVYAGVRFSSSSAVFYCQSITCYPDPYDPLECTSIGDWERIVAKDCSGSTYCDDLVSNPELLPKLTDEQCKSSNGDSISVSASGANYLNNGGTVKTNGGACSITGAGGVTACSGTDDNITCSLSIESTSTGEYGEFNEDSSLNGGWGESNGTFSVVDFNTPDYLEPLPGGCSDPSSCVTIGDTSYLVDWESAPDYFSYVDSNGTTHSNPSSGGGGGNNGGGDPTDPTNPTDPTDPGGDSGGGSGGGGDSGNDDSDDNNGGGGSGGGSTVPDFEFDESGIIEAIGTAGQANQNAINALSNDVTGAISDQTNDLNAATSAQTNALNSTLNSQTNSLTSSLDGQTDDLTSALEDQTGTITNSLDALGTTFTDALKGLGLGSGDDDSGDGDGEGEDGEGDGLLGGISKLLNKMVDKLASRFTEDLDEGDDLFDSTGMDDTLDGAALQEQEHGDEINSLMDEIGDGASSDIAEQITSRLPSLPSGGCVPLQFGPMEISCQAFNTIKLWLTWIIYFWTVVSIVDTFFRSEQRTA